MPVVTTKPSTERRVYVTLTDAKTRRSRHLTVYDCTTAELQRLITRAIREEPKRPTDQSNPVATPTPDVPEAGVNFEPAEQPQTAKAAAGHSVTSRPRGRRASTHPHAGAA